MSTRSMRKKYAPDPSIVAVPKIVAVPAVLSHTNASSSIEFTLRAATGPWSWYVCWPWTVAPVTRAVPPNVASSPLLATIAPPTVTVTSQALTGTIHVFVASANGSGGTVVASCVPLRFVSAKAWIVFVPGSDALKQNWACPLAFVTTDAPVGLALVAVAFPTEKVKVALPLAFVTAEPLVGFLPVTVKRAVAPETGCAPKSVTVAVTVCGFPTSLVSVAGASVSVYGAPTVMSLVTNASELPLAVVSYSPGVVGKSEALAKPVTYAAPLASSAMAWPRSLLPMAPELPPRNVEYTRLPAAPSLVTKASSPPFQLVSKAPGVVGKFVELVRPVSVAMPAVSTAMPGPRSSTVPPR